MAAADRPDRSSLSLYLSLGYLSATTTDADGNTTRTATSRTLDAMVDSMTPADRAGLAVQCTRILAALDGRETCQNTIPQLESGPAVFVLTLAVNNVWMVEEISRMEASRRMYAPADIYTSHMLAQAAADQKNAGPRANIAREYPQAITTKISR